jgi:hypothetical protein
VDANQCGAESGGARKEEQEAAAELDGAGDITKRRAVTDRREERHPAGPNELLERED